MLKEILDKFDQQFGLYKDPDGVQKLVKQFFIKEITALLERLKSDIDKEITARMRDITNTKLDKRWPSDKSC